MNFRQIKAIEAANEARILKANTDVPEMSGIYILTRYENGFKYAYVGQAKNILSRLCQHLSGYQHIDLSLKKHGLYNENNLTGWHIQFFVCENLDEMEQKYIKQYANNGYQLRNETAGGQNEGKFSITDNVRKGYQQGLQNGYKNARKDLQKLFEKNLIVEINGQTNKNKEKALQKFKDLLKST